MPALPTIRESTIELICKHLRHGAHLSIAAMAAGIDRDTFYRWVKLGGVERRRRSLGREWDNEKDIYVEALERFEKSMCEGEINDLYAVSLAIKKDWRAAAWRLEHRRAKRWANKEYKDSASNQNKINIKVVSPKKKKKKSDAR